MGFSVATALAEQASQLVDRAGQHRRRGRPRTACSLPFLAELGYAPVIGQAMWRLTPDFAVEDGYAEAFAPGFDLADGFAEPRPGGRRLPGDDLHLVRERAEAADDFVEERAARRPRAPGAPVPLLSIFGTEDQICDPEASQAAYEAVPGARIAEVKGAGHSPNVEQPEETAALIEEFAAGRAPADDGDAAAPTAGRGAASSQAMKSASGESAAASRLQGDA